MTHLETVQDQEQDFTDDIAVSWYWRLQEPDVSPEELQRFQAWIAVDEHREAFDRAATVWEETCRAAGAGTDTPSSRVLNHVLVRAAIVLLLLTLFWPGPETPVRILEAGNTTNARVLTDGSFAKVAPHSRLEISFDERERSSYLPRGQAFFHVSKEDSRPFIVRTPAATVRATGTRFGVTYQQKTSVVLVTEGAVIVTGSDAVPPGSSAPAARSWYLEAGQRLRVSPAGASSEPDDALDWATTITFEREPPGVALARFNRLSDVRLELPQPGAPGALITGTYQLDDPRGVAAKIANETSTPVRMYQRAAGGAETFLDTVQPGDTHGIDPQPH